MSKVHCIDEVITRHKSIGKLPRNNELNCTCNSYNDVSDLTITISGLAHTTFDAFSFELRAVGGPRPGPL